MINTEMKKEILDRGYITHSLTDSNGEIFCTHNGYINLTTHAKLTGTHFYWSEVYVEPQNFATIIRKGTLLVDPSEEELQNYFKQSKINFSK